MKKQAYVFFAGAALAAAVVAGCHSIHHSTEVQGALGPFVSRGDIAGVVSVLSDKDYNETWDVFGYADAESGRPMTPDTVFAVFSMSKTFLGAAVMCAIDDGVISLDDNVSKFLPEYANIRFADGRKPKRELTIRDVTCHVDGLQKEITFMNNTIPLREAARQYAAQPLTAEPGETFRYGTTRFAVAGACLEIATGQRYEDYLCERILRPLGMRDTTFNPTPDQIRRMVKPYTTRGGRFRPAADSCCRQLDFPKAQRLEPSPGGGLFSTPADMIRFSQMLAHHGDYKGKTVITRKTFDGIFSVLQVDPRLRQPYTCGAWRYGDWFGHEGAMRTDQRANLTTGESRVFFIQTENAAGKAFFDAKIAWHKACDVYQREKIPFQDELVKSHENDVDRTKSYQRKAAGASDGQAASLAADDRAAYLKNYQSVDTNRAMHRLERLWRHEVCQTMSAKRRAAETVVQYLKEDGFSDIQSIELPTDGKTVFLDNRMPFAWEASVGRLTLTKTGGYEASRNLWSGGGDESPVLADYAVHPFHLVKGSTAVRPGGVTARVLTEAQFLSGEDAKGAIVVLEPDTWPRAKMLTPLLDRGALGFVCDQLVGGFDTPDAIQWVTACTETSSWSCDEETRPFVGFSVSPRTGRRLRTMAAAGGVEVKVECDGRRVPTTMPFVTAVVPGRSKKEFWLHSHIYEPLASDDSNGAVASIETARRFIGREKPAYTIRVLFGIEYYGYAAYFARIGCPLRDRVVGAINLDSIPCQKDTYLGLQLAGPATPFCGNLVYEGLASSLVGLPEMLDVEFKRMGEYFDDYFIAEPLIGVPMVGALHVFKGTRYWHNSRQDFDYMDPEIYRRALAFVATYVDRMVNPSAALVPAASAMAERRLVRARKEARTHEHFDHLASLERRNLADVNRVVGAGTADAALAAFDRRATTFANEIKEDKPTDSPWRRYAAGIVPSRKTVGFTQDQTRVPRALRMGTAAGVIYEPLGNVIANIDGKKSLDRLLREAEYETGTVFDDAKVAEYVRTVCFLADWDYLSLTNANELKVSDVTRALTAAGVKKGDVLLVDANLENVGHLAGGADAVLAALRDVVGSEGTVLLPAFTPSVRLCGKVNRSWDYRPYDPADVASVAKTSPITAAFLRQQPTAKRSAHLVRSWTGFGSRAAEFLSDQLPDSPPYGEDSPMAKVLAAGGKFVHIGSVPDAAEVMRYLAVRARKATCAPAVVGVRTADGGVRDVILQNCPVGEAVAPLPKSARVAQSPLGLSRISAVDLKSLLN